MRILTLFFILYLAIQTDGQASFGVIDGRTAVDKGVLTLGTELEGVQDAELVSSEDNGDKDYSDDVLVIPNEFPETLTRICYPRTPLMRDRFCIGNVDAFALACAGKRPPLQLAPFCQGFDDICDQFDFPEDDWIFPFTVAIAPSMAVFRAIIAPLTSKIAPVSPTFVYGDRRVSNLLVIVKSMPGSHLLSPYAPLRYELFCNAEERRKSSLKLVSVLESSIRLHAHCYTLWNVARTICNPFRNKYDFKRCQKFLFDCELIGDFEEEDREESLLINAEKEVNKTLDSSSPVLIKKPFAEENTNHDTTTTTKNSTATSPTKPHTASHNPLKNPFSRLRLA